MAVHRGKPLPAMRGRGKAVPGFVPRGTLREPRTDRLRGWLGGGSDTILEFMEGFEKKWSRLTLYVRGR